MIDVLSFLAMVAYLLFKVALALGIGVVWILVSFIIADWFRTFLHDFKNPE